MAKKGSKFNKYRYEFKVQVAQDYLSGKSGDVELKQEIDILFHPKSIKIVACGLERCLVKQIKKPL